MKQRRRIYYSDSQKALMWERRRSGESLQHIAQLFDRNHSSVQRILAEIGRIQPARRHGSSLALTLAEREEISRSIVAGCSIRPVASRLGRAPSTISRATGKVICDLAERTARLQRSSNGGPRFVTLVKIAG